MEPAWCFLCRIERSGADPRIAWGLDARVDEGDPEDRPGPMTLAQASYLRFLCDEFGETFDASLTDVFKVQADIASQVAGARRHR